MPDVQTIAVTSVETEKPCAIMQAPATAIALKPNVEIAGDMKETDFETKIAIPSVAAASAKIHRTVLGFTHCSPSRPRIPRESNAPASSESIRDGSSANASQGCA